MHRTCPENRPPSVGPRERAPATVSGAAAWAFALTSVIACGSDPESFDCTDEYRMTPSGLIQDEQGNPVAVTRVVRSDPGFADFDCNFGLGRYECGERSPGEVKVTVHLGSRTWSKMVEIGADGCHSERVQLDFVLDDLPVCEPAAAVDGSLLGPNDEALNGARVELLRADVADDVPVACSVEQERYSCPAAMLYEGQDYILRASFGVTTREVDLHVAAKDCQVATRHHDFVLR